MAKKTAKKTVRKTAKKAGKKKVVKKTPAKTTKMGTVLACTTLSKDRLEARTQIIKDAIKNIKSSKVVPTFGVYVQENASYGIKIDSLSESTAMSEPLLKKFKETNCEVCAIGTMFITAIDKHNELFLHDFPDANIDITNIKTLSASVDIPDAINQPFIHNYLSKWFDSNELFIIEDFFEGGCGTSLSSRTLIKFLTECGCTEGVNVDTADEKLGSFINEWFTYVSNDNLRWHSPKFRLLAILENMLENGTYFKPRIPKESLV